MRTVGLFHSIESDRAFSTPFRLWKGEGDCGLIPFRRFDPHHAVELLDTILSLCRLACLSTEAVDEALQFGDFALLVFVGCPLLFLAGGFLREVGIVVAPVAVELVMADF